MLYITTTELNHQVQQCFYGAMYLEFQLGRGTRGSSLEVEWHRGQSMGFRFKGPEF